MAQGETEDRATFKNALRRRTLEKTSTLYSTYRNDKSACGGVTMTAATSSSSASGRFIDVNGAALYYEEQGEGDPHPHPRWAGIQRQVASGAAPSCRWFP